MVVKSSPNMGLAPRTRGLRFKAWRFRSAGFCEVVSPIHHPTTNSASDQRQHKGALVLVEHGRKVWETQAKALAKAPFIKKGRADAPGSGDYIHMILYYVCP